MNHYNKERGSNYTNTNKKYVASSFKLAFLSTELYTELKNFMSYIIYLLAIIHMQGQYHLAIIFYLAYTKSQAGKAGVNKTECN